MKLIAGSISYKVGGLRDELYDYMDVDVMPDSVWFTVSAVTFGDISRYCSDNVIALYNIETLRL